MNIVKSYYVSTQAFIMVEIGLPIRRIPVSYFVGPPVGQELRGDPLVVDDMEQPIAEIVKQCSVTDAEARQAVFAYLDRRYQ